MSNPEKHHRAEINSLREKSRAKQGIVAGIKGPISSCAPPEESVEINEVYDSLPKATV